MIHVSIGASFGKLPSEINEAQYDRFFDPIAPHVSDLHSNHKVSSYNQYLKRYTSRWTNRHYLYAPSYMCNNIMGASVSSEVVRSWNFITCLNMSDLGSKIGFIK